MGGVVACALCDCVVQWESCEWKRNGLNHQELRHLSPSTAQAMVEARNLEGTRSQQQPVTEASKVTAILNPRASQLRGHDEAGGAKHYGRGLHACSMLASSESRGIEILPPCVLSQVALALQLNLKISNMNKIPKH